MSPTPNVRLPGLRTERVRRRSTAALEAAYQRGENDEFVQATAVVPAGEEAVFIEDGDSVIFMNFRADRARELVARGGQREPELLGPLPQPHAQGAAHHVEALGADHAELRYAL